MFLTHKLGSLTDTQTKGWLQMRDRDIALAVNGLCEEFPILSRCEGDWACDYFLRTYNDSHNRTIKERREAEGNTKKHQIYMLKRNIQACNRLLKASGEKLAELEVEDSEPEEHARDRGRPAGRRDRTGGPVPSGPAAIRHG